MRASSHEGSRRTPTASPTSSASRSLPDVPQKSHRYQLFVNKPEKTSKFGVKMCSEEVERGKWRTWIEWCKPGGLMDQAGARVNDRIISINNTAVCGCSFAQLLFEKAEPGQSIVVVEREDAPILQSL